MTSPFWHGRKILLTGHTGFKGSWLTFLLHAEGSVLTGLSLDPPTTPSLFDLLQGQKLCRDIRGDIRSLDTVQAAVKEAQPELVLHFAAQPLVRASYELPIETFGTNVMGTAHVLEAVRQVPSVRAVVIITTDKVYENDGSGRAFSEDQPLGGHDPYSASKACAEHVAASYRDSFLRERGVLVATARAGNVVGGGDFAADRLLPDLIRAFQRGQPAKIRNPRATRPFQHVLDPLHGYLQLAQQLLEGRTELARAFNFGPAPELVLSVQEVCEHAVQAWGAPASWTSDPGPHPHEAPLLSLDPERASQLLGVRGLLSPAEAIDWTVRFHRALRDGEPAAELLGRDVEAYRALVSAAALSR